MDFVVRTLMAREPATPLHALGFSLGGNVLLKWLGEQGITSAIRSAAVISVPYDLAAASNYLERPVGRIYYQHFVPRLKTKALDLLARFPRETAHVDPDRVRLARTFREFDECLTAPLHGFASAEDYYQRSSAHGYLDAIRIPALCIASEDDPFIPADSVTRARDAASAQVRFEVSPWGGHTGFVAGPWPWRPVYWAEEATVAWLAPHLS